MSAPTSRDSWPSWTLPSTRTMMRSESTESTTPDALADHHRARIARRDPLHAGADIRRVGAQQRNGLALHVRSHERAVGVVVLEERNQARGHRDELLRADVDVLDLVRGASARSCRPGARSTRSGTMWPFSSSSTLACAMMYLSSSHAERYSQWASNSAGCFFALELAIGLLRSPRAA